MISDKFHTNNLEISTKFINFAPNNKSMKRIILLFFASAFVAIISIAQNKSNFHMEISAQSKYLWRGIEYGTAPVLFPTLSYDNNGLYIYGMGGYATDGSHQEVDLGISYTYKSFTISLNDYYYPTAVGDNDKYFNLKSKETGHWVESCIQYSPTNIPFWCMLSTYIAGADKKTESGNQAWSSYAEMGGHYDFDDNNILSLVIGAALNKSFYNDYSHSFSICNIELKYSHDFSLKYFTIPVSVSYIVNPYREKSYVSFSTAFRY